MEVPDTCKRVELNGLHCTCYSISCYKIISPVVTAEDSLPKVIKNFPNFMFNKGVNAILDVLSLSNLTHAYIYIYLFILRAYCTHITCTQQCILRSYKLTQPAISIPGCSQESHCVFCFENNSVPFTVISKSPTENKYKC